MDLPVESMVHGTYRVIRNSGVRLLKKQIERLSFQSERSWFAVVEIEAGSKYEVIDGNHRLDVLRSDKYVVHSCWPLV